MPTRTTALAALALILAATATPAAAQDDPAPSAAADEAAAFQPADAADLACDPGALGVGGSYENPDAADGEITRAQIAWQCEEFLSDGTYVPEGYRLQLHYACGANECPHPFAFATPANNPEAFAATAFEDGRRTRFQIRLDRQDRLVVTVVEAEVGGGEPERRRHVLTPGG